MKVEDIMSQELIVGYVPGTVQDALKTLAAYNVSGMPILKKDTKKAKKRIRTHCFRLFCRCQ